MPCALTYLYRTVAALTLSRRAIAATVDAFVVHMLGHRQVSVYDASLMEWGGNPELPMTNPSADQTSSS